MDIARWNKFNLPQKLGNIGSEVARARLSEEKKDYKSRDAALERVFGMLDLILDAQPTPAQKKELSRVRELLNCWYSGQDLSSFSPLLIEEYFTQFAFLIA